MLAVVVILGVVVTIVLSTGPSSLKSTTTGGTAAGTTTTTVKSIGTEAKAAAVSSCLGNYSIVNTALGYYKTLEGSLPPAGTAWATSSSNGGTLESWPTDAPYYTITWNGVTLSVIPKHGTSSRGTAGTRAPPTGCYGA